MRRCCFDTEHVLFRDTFRAFMRNEVVPIRDRCLDQGFVDRSVWRRAGEMGFLVPQAPDSVGGLGVEDFRYQQIMAEEMGLCGESGFLIFLHNTIVAPYFLRHASSDLTQRYLPSAISGEAVLGIAMTEPDHGSDLAGIRTTAVRKGNHYCLNGGKTYISNGIIGDVFIVAARTGEQGKTGISLFVVEADWPGFHRGRKLKKMGMHSQDTAELVFDDLMVPADNLLGQEGQGFYYLMSGLAEERLICAIWNHASALYALEQTCAFVRDRKVFGQAVAAYQNTQFVLANLKARLDMAQAYLDLLVQNVNDQACESVDAASAKLLCSELQGDVADECLQLYGGAGYMDEYPISRLYADARITRIFAGTSEVMKSIIARSMSLG